MPDCSSKASVRVATRGDIFRNATRSTGLSISIPIPGWRTMSGSNSTRSCRIEMRKKAVFAEPQRNRVRRRADDGVRSEIVMRGHDGERRRGPVRCEGRRDLGWRQSRNVAGHCHHGALPFAHEQPSRSRDGAGMAFARAFRDDARAVATGKRCRGRIDRDDKHAGKLPDRAHASSTSSSMVVASRRRSSGLKADDSRCLAPSNSLTGTTAQMPLTRRGPACASKRQARPPPQGRREPVARAPRDSS